MSNLINDTNWRNASEEEQALLKSRCEERTPFLKSAYIIIGSIFTVPCILLFIVNAIYLHMIFIYVLLSVIIITVIYLLFFIDSYFNRYSKLLSKGLYKVQSGKMIRKEPEQYDLNIKDCSVLFEDCFEKTISVPVITEDYLKATEGSCLIIKWEDRFQNGKYGIVMCDSGNAGWRRAFSSEASLVKENAACKYKEKRNAAIGSLVLFFVCIIVALIAAVFFHTSTGISICVIGPIAVVFNLIYMLKLSKFPKLVADGNYEVMNGRIIDKNIVKKGNNSIYNVLFADEYGYSMKLTVSKKEYENSSANSCLLYRIKSISMIKKEEVFLL